MPAGHRLHDLGESCTQSCMHSWCVTHRHDCSCPCLSHAAFSGSTLSKAFDPCCSKTIESKSTTHPCHELPECHVICTASLLQGHQEGARVQQATGQAHPDMVQPVHVERDLVADVKRHVRRQATFNQATPHILRCVSHVQTHAGKIVARPH